MVGGSLWDLEEMGGWQGYQAPSPRGSSRQAGVWGRMGASVSVFLLQQEEFPSCWKGWASPAWAVGRVGVGGAAPC